MNKDFILLLLVIYFIAHFSMQSYFDYLRLEDFKKFAKEISEYNKLCPINMGGINWESVPK